MLLRDATGRIAKTARIGFVLGLGWGILIAALALLSGTASFEDRHGVTPAYQLVAVLVVGGTVAGALTGLLLPLARNRLGAFVVGSIALSPYMSGLVWVRGQAWQPLIAVLGSVIVGGGAGLILCQIVQEEHEETG